MLAILRGDAVAQSKSIPIIRASSCSRCPISICKWWPLQSGCTRHILKCAARCPSALTVCSIGARASSSPSCGTYSIAKATKCSPSHAPRHTCGGIRQLCHIFFVFLRSISGCSKCDSTTASSVSTDSMSSLLQGRTFNPNDSMLFIMLSDRKRQGARLCLLG